jgi:hypothetical protein
VNEFATANHHYQRCCALPSAQIQRLMPLRRARWRITMQFAMLAFILISCICKLLFAAPTTSNESRGVHARAYEELEPIERENWLPNDPQVTLKEKKKVLSEVQAQDSYAFDRTFGSSSMHLCYQVCIPATNFQHRSCFCAGVRAGFYL